jgi:hypothetical protein
MSKSQATTPRILQMLLDVSANATALSLSTLHNAKNCASASTTAADGIHTIVVALCRCSKRKKL